MSASGATFDPALGAAYVRINNHHIYRTVEVGHGVNLDLDRTGDLVGVEVLWTGSDENEHVAKIAAEQAARWKDALTMMSYGVDDPRG